MNECLRMPPDASSPPSSSPGAYLAAELERLMALPLATPAEVAHWDEECATVQRTLERRFPHFEFEHEVWHFFNDSDIRARDAGYCERQHRLMSEYVHRLCRR
ncbi:MAG TPA: hypothetical protein VK961_08735 [Chthoniobacter sp.]|nr:hypothetical protein [Chthoniobacter sp.]